jgi:hypothetical protein
MTDPRMLLASLAAPFSRSSHRSRARGDIFQARRNVFQPRRIKIQARDNEIQAGRNEIKMAFPSAIRAFSKVYADVS